MRGVKRIGLSNLNKCTVRVQDSKNLPRRHKVEKVAILGSMPPLRALSSYCFELASAIVNLGKVEFISFRRIYPTLLYPKGGLRDDHTFPALVHPNLEVRRRLTWYNPVTWINEGLLTDADLLHAQWWSLPLACIYFIVCLGFRLRRRPVVFTVHNILQHGRSPAYKIITRILFKMGDHFIVHSASNMGQLAEIYKIPPERITWIPHGPLDLHVKNDLDRDSIRDSMGFDPGDRVILMFGAIRPYKGVDTALEAFAKVRHEVPEARLLIAGRLWEDWDPYERLIRELGIADYIKTDLRYIPSEEVCSFFLVSDLVILPYKSFDSQSGIGATAISFRKPMIVTDVGGLPETVADQRYVVPPRNPEALARSLIECLQDPDRLAEMSAGADEIAEKISWPVVARKTWSIYENMLDLKSKS